MNNRKKTRKEKIKLLKDIAEGRAPIDKLIPREPQIGWMFNGGGKPSWYDDAGTDDRLIGMTPAEGCAPIGTTPDVDTMRTEPGKRKRSWFGKTEKVEDPKPKPLPVDDDIWDQPDAAAEGWAPRGVRIYKLSEMNNQENFRVWRSDSNY